jgi:NAD(P)-dependent dehydrogenase (short-subunit alcohol dehydrogenase family)
MSSRFENQIAIVTGGASGLGKAIAERIASEGGHVALFDLENSDCDSLAADFQSKGWNATSHSVDVTDEERVARAMKTIAETHGRIDIVINPRSRCRHRGFRPNHSGQSTRLFPGR